MNLPRPRGGAPSAGRRSLRDLYRDLYKGSRRSRPTMVNVLDASGKEECENLSALWGGVFSVSGKFEEGACILVHGPDGGWTGPVKGAYFSWGSHDLAESLELFEGKAERFQPEVFGCLVGDGPYPSFAGGCSPILEERYDPVSSHEEALEIAKDDALEIFADVAEGNAKFWLLHYCDARTGEKIDPDSEWAVASDNCKKVKELFEKLEEQYA